jgi:hypothetical protein
MIQNIPLISVIITIIILDGCNEDWEKALTIKDWS